MKDKSENLKAGYRQHFINAIQASLAVYSHNGRQREGTLVCYLGRGTTPREVTIEQMSGSNVLLSAITHQVDSWFSLLPSP